MKRHLKVFALVGLAISGLTSTGMTNTTNLVFSISLEKSDFCSSEPIIVTSRLANNGSSGIPVIELNASPHVVTFSIYRINGIDRQNISDGALGGIGMGVWLLPSLMLKPGATMEGSRELQPGITDESLTPGSYSLKATYHFADPSSKDYKKDVLVASELLFSVTPLDTEEKMVLAEYTQCMTNADFGKRIEQLELFLERHRKTFYRQFALSGINEVLYKNKKENLAAIADIYRRIRMEHISTYRKERCLYLEATILDSMGKYSEALNVLKESAVSTSIDLRNSINRKISRK